MAANAEDQGVSTVNGVKMSFSASGPPRRYRGTPPQEGQGWFPKTTICTRFQWKSFVGIDLSQRGIT